MTNLTKIILPGATVGIVGGGQLGQMMALAAKEMGFRVGVLDPTPDCPCGQVADWQIIAAYQDEAALSQLAEKSDVLTFEFENVHVATLDRVASGTYFPQGTHLLAISQNRLKEKSFLQSLGLPVAPFVPLENIRDLRQAVAKLGYPCVLKTTTDGYDGKGQVVFTAEVDEALAAPLLAHGACVLEAWVPFVKELSIMVAGNEAGELSFFPVVENDHRHNILHATLVPAAISTHLSNEVQALAKKIATAVKLVGTLAVEIFLTPDGELFVNELAPRPHNSGHYSIEACTISQFTAHLRGICNWPLPPVRLLSPAVMVNILGEHLAKSYGEIPRQRSWNFHLYGKALAKTGRKMGHITILTTNLTQTLKEIQATKIWDA